MGSRTLTYIGPTTEDMEHGKQYRFLDWLTPRRTFIRTVEKPTVAVHISKWKETGDV